MIRDRVYAVLAVLVCAAVARAQVPKAVITGPREAVSGDMVILDASQSTGQKYLWRLLEADKSFLAVDNNLKCIFAAGVDATRTFHFVLIAAGTNANGGPEVDIATHDLVMQPRANVQPVTPVNPQPVNPTPGPTAQAARALIVIESASVTPDQAKTILTIRNERTLGPKVETLDPDAETQDGKPDPLAQQVKAYLGAKSLPRLVGLSSAGACTTEAELPASGAAAIAVLKGWGL